MLKSAFLDDIYRQSKKLSSQLRASFESLHLTSVTLTGNLPKNHLVFSDRFLIRYSLGCGIKRKVYCTLSGVFFNIREASTPYLGHPFRVQ